MHPLDFTDLVMVDDIIPSDFSPFRTIEYEHYLRFFNSALLSLEGWHAWIGNENFDDLLSSFPIDPGLKHRIVPFRTHSNITARLGYVTFLGNAIRLVSYFESRRIPFVLQLYPGGGFEIDRPETDEKLRRVLLSGMCQKVIVTQRITERYIIDKIGFDPAKIEHIFGGVFESRLPFSFDRDKSFYPKDKNTIDLCFVAHKYAGNLTSKGYDQFVAIALELAGAFTQLRFHVVGDYLSEDVPLEEYRSRFTFYGRRSSAFLADFYRSMDAIISINRPFDLTPGAFDGFPTGACIEAGFHGVLNCVNDPLDLNPCFTDGHDIILLNLDHQRSAARLRDLIANPTELYRIAEQCWRKFHSTFDTDRQLWARTRVLAAELIRHEGLITRPSPNPSALDAEPFEQALLPYREHITILEEQSKKEREHVTILEEHSKKERERITILEAQSKQESESDAEDLRIQAAMLADQLNAIKVSTSWRLTSPLRRVLNPFPKLARLGTRGLKLIWWTLSLQLVSRYRARLATKGAIMRQSEQAQFRLTAAEEQPGPQSLLPLTVQNNEETAETGRALSLHGDRTAEIERALSRETNSGLPNPRFSRRAAAWWPNSLRRRTVEIERTLSLHADRMAGIERALSLHGDRTVEIEHTLSLHGDRLDGLNARAADLNWEIRWDQTRTDFALGAIEGMTNEIDRFQEERRKEDFQAVFEQAEPLVSVCVATADRASLLFERCIPSLLAQTYQNLQIVVVGDHCTDDTEHRFAELRDDRVTFVNLTQRGPYPPSGRERWCVAGSNAMNAALEQCKGHFITHLDDDDRYVSNRIERLVHACLEQKAEFCWHPFWAEREDGNWDMIGDGRFAVNQVNPGAVFYHRYFARFRWDPLAYQIDEPGDWNRFRKIKMLGPKRLFVAEPLLHHHRERQQPNDSERFADC